jgi:hypothetical protein
MLLTLSDREMYPVMWPRSGLLDHESPLSDAVNTSPIYPCLTPRSLESSCTILWPSTGGNLLTPREGSWLKLKKFSRLEIPQS